jgi:Molecular chaperone (small heat shock protein)
MKTASESPILRGSCRKESFVDRDKLHREVLRTFDNACISRSAQYSSRAGFVPLADVYFEEESRQLVVRFELPGLTREVIQLEVEPRKVVVHGRRSFSGGDGRVYQQVEMDYGDFERHIRFAVDVDVDATEATYEAGILEVRLPLVADEPRKQRIEIRIGGES